MVVHSHGRGHRQEAKTIEKIPQQKQQDKQLEPHVNPKELVLKKIEALLEDMILKPVDDEDPVVTEQVSTEETIEEGRATQDINNSVEKESSISEVKKPVLKSSLSIHEISLKMKDLKIPKNSQPDVVSFIMKATLSKTDGDRENASNLLVNLHRQGLVVNNTVFMTSIRKLLSQLKSLELDDPLVKTHLSEFVSRAVANDILSLQESLELVDSFYPMFLLILQQLSHVKGKEWLTCQLETSKINLMSVLPEVDRNKEQLADILETRGLSYLMPLLRIESDLNKLLSKEESSPAVVFKWIKENVDPSLTTSKGFVFLLFSCIMRHVSRKVRQECNDDKKVAEAEKEGIKSFVNLLKSFVFDKTPLQLTALYAMQSVAHEVKFPKGMLLTWFNSLYDDEVVEDEVFLKWKEDINDDYPGKGQALFQVNTWLIWLAETEADEEEDEDNDEENPEED